MSHEVLKECWNFVAQSSECLSRHGVGHESLPNIRLKTRGIEDLSVGFFFLKIFTYILPWLMGLTCELSTYTQT